MRSKRKLSAQQVTNKSIVPRGLARSDVEAAVDYYVLDVGTEVALGFIDASKAAYDLTARHPESGSLRYGYELGLPDLRSMSRSSSPLGGSLSRRPRF